MRIQTPLTDLSDADLAYAALRESGDRVRQLAEHMRDVFWLSAIPHDGFLYLNPAFETVFGCSVETLYDSPEHWFDAIHPEDRQRVCSAWTELDGSFDGWDIEYRIVRPDGEIRWLHERAFAIRDSDGQAYRAGGVSADITVQKESELAIQQYQSLLLEMALELDNTADQERRRISEGLHDDVGQNLALIRLQLGRLRKSLPEAEREVLDQAADLVQQTIHSIRKLMFELSPPQLYELGYWAAIDWLASRLQSQAGFELACDDDCPDVRLSEHVTTVLFRVTRELLHNVVKHSGTTTAIIRRFMSGDTLCIEVRDDGCGFTVAQPECRGSESLGLFLCCERMRALGGSLRIQSKPGEGTLVTLTVPSETAS